MKARLMIMFDVIPGKEQEYQSFLHTKGLKFWRDIPELTAMRSYRVVVGSGPQIVAEMEFSSVQAAIKALFGDEYARVKKEQAKYVTNVQSRLLKPAVSEGSAAGGC